MRMRRRSGLWISAFSIGKETTFDPFSAHCRTQSHNNTTNTDTATRSRSRTQTRQVVATAHGTRLTCQQENPLNRRPVRERPYCWSRVPQVYLSIRLAWLRYNNTGNFYLHVPWGRKANLHLDCPLTATEKSCKKEVARKRWPSVGCNCNSLYSLRCRGPSICDTGGSDASDLPQRYSEGVQLSSCARAHWGSLSRNSSPPCFSNIGLFNNGRTGKCQLTHGMIWA